MTNTKYTLRYLPLFYEDLEEKVVYIAEKLHNVKAANDLIDEVEQAILERQPVAYRTTLYCWGFNPQSMI